MAKRKVEKMGMKEVRITGPNCRLDNRLYMPGETATVPVEIAQEWINDERAVDVTAEVADGDW